MAHGGDEVAWEWEDDIGWVEYGRNVSAFIENCYSNQALGDVWLGASDKDLTDYKISFSSMVQTRLLTGKQRKIRRVVRPKTADVNFTWQWYEHGSWIDYDPVQNSILNRDFDSGNDICQLTMRNQTYTVDFRRMVQMNNYTSFSRQIRKVQSSSVAGTSSGSGVSSTSSHANRASRATRGPGRNAIGLSGLGFTSHSKDPLANQTNSMIAPNGANLVSARPMSAASSRAGMPSQSKPQLKYFKRINQSYDAPNAFTSTPTNTTSAASNGRILTQSSSSSQSATSRDPLHKSTLGAADQSTAYGGLRSSGYQNQSLSVNNASQLQSTMINCGRPHSACRRSSLCDQSCLSSGKNAATQPATNDTGYSTDSESIEIGQPDSESSNEETENAKISSKSATTLAELGVASDLPQIMLENLLLYVPPESSDDKDKDNCPICLLDMDTVYDDMDERDKGAGKIPSDLALTFPCKHPLHYDCAQEVFKNNESNFLSCPICKRVFGGVLTGGQPENGTMTCQMIPDPCAGYEDCSTYQIVYNFPPGLQGPKNPHPGKPYNRFGFPRVAYLPNNQQGTLLVKMLRVAFDRRLIFTVDRSHVTGMEDCVVWGSVHHKTSLSGGEHGFPDPAHLITMKEDLAALKVTENDVHDAVGISSF